MPMYEYCRRFHFAADMNGDGVFTISDVFLIAKQIWLLPANLIVGTLQEIPIIATFFEMDCSTGQSFGGAIFSLFAWFIIFIVLGVMLGK
ncbi:MAG TPA: hypothetical protein VN929_16660 [Burkholderiales bacterium]|nr:hypothetical protein [Burkholderiales bacterium]